MLGFDALGKLALGELPRQAIGPVYAVFVAAAAATLSTTVRAEASTVSAMSGVGAYAPVVVGQASGALASSGLGAFTVAGLSQPNSVMTGAGIATVAFTPEVLTFSVAALAGLSTVTSQGISIASSVAGCSGSASFASTIRAEVSSVAMYSGASSFGAADALESLVSFTGTSVFAAVSYAFYADAERACLHQGVSTIEIQPEDRTAIIPAEYRVHHVAADRPGAGSQPRKRVC